MRGGVHARRRRRNRTKTESLHLVVGSLNNSSIEEKYGAEAAEPHLIKLINLGQVYFSSFEVKNSSFK